MSSNYSAGRSLEGATGAFHAALWEDLRRGSSGQSRSLFTWVGEVLIENGVHPELVQTAAQRASDRLIQDVDDIIGVENYEQ